MYGLQPILVSLVAATIAAAEQVVFDSGYHSVLQKQFGNRLQPAIPFAAACFPNEDPAEAEGEWRTAGYQEGFPGVNSTDNACQKVHEHYLNEFTRSTFFSAQIQPQWEGCQKTGEDCLLDWKNTNNPAALAAPRTCSQGSVSEYYIEVESPEDVQYAFGFSKVSKIPLVIKNTGHDYKGRSSAPGSLALWMHKLKSITRDEKFVPEGCPADFAANDAVTMGAGVQWREAYQFADKHDITLAGGSDEAVGAVGGWLQGGGHGALSNTLGLGIDRVLQFKVVTPDGSYRTANACQNQDLFWALRGGGGGTFGVVMEATEKAAPKLTLQVMFLQWSKDDVEQSRKYTRQLFKILIDNGLKWSDEGWGGYVWPERVIYITPVLSKQEAVNSMDPLLNFVRQAKQDGVPGTKVMQLTFPSWKSFYDTFATGDNAAKVGIPLAIASRLVPRANFATPETRKELLDAFMAAHAMTPNFRLLLGPPSGYKGDEATSINPAWRDSIFHVTMVSSWNFDATTEDKSRIYKLVDDSIEHLRKVTPNAAVYSNEASVHEPLHEPAFWGDNYRDLLEVKKKYDPHHLLDCWHCVGWNPYSSRFSCYL